MSIIQSLYGKEHEYKVQRRYLYSIGSIQAHRTERG